MFERHQYNRQIAIELKSPDKAFMVEFIKWSIEFKADKPEQYEAHTDGRYYTWDTHATWLQRMPWLSSRTIARYLAEIRESGFVHAECLSTAVRDRTLYYTINYERYCQIEQLHCANLATSILPNLHNEILPNWQHVPSNTLTNTLTKKTRVLQKLHKDCILFDEAMANKWIVWSKTMSPNGRFNHITFANAIMKMRVKHSMTEEMIRYMLDWIIADDFWAKNAISPASLIKPSPSNPDITKLDRVISAIKTRKKSQSEKVYDAVLGAEAELARREAQAPKTEKIYLEGEPW